MPQLQLTLSVGAADPAPFEEALLAAGATSITLQDAADDPVLEPLPGTTPLWPTVRIQALFDAASEPDSILSALRDQIAGPLPQVDFEILADRAWEREWLKDFRPMRFGRRLWICPAGQRPAAEPMPGADDPSPFCCIDLDPGLAFGTGTHPTTALCLEWLDSAAVVGKHVIDYGCGSGVLAIAALKLGAAHALAVDIDPQALLATADNARRNGVAERLTVCPVDRMPAAAADILLANILAEPLERLAPEFAALLASGGRLVLSGLLRMQVDPMARRYAPWFDIAPASFRDDWARLDGKRR